MIIMLTYRCSLDCDHCMLYDTGPDGRHMSHEVFAAAMRLRRTIGSNQLGIAGGEAVEHPDFWSILAAVREQAIAEGFSVKVATSGEPFEKDPKLMDLAEKLAPVTFQVTRTIDFYGPLALRERMCKTSNFYFNELSSFYYSRKAKERGFVRPLFVREREKVFCGPCYWLKKHTITELRPKNSAAFVRQWEGYHELCSLHVHPDGTVRLGPLELCRSVGDVVALERELREGGSGMLEAIGEKPCRKCGMTGEVR